MRFLTYNLWHGLSPTTPVAYEALEPVARRELRERLQLDVLEKLSADIAFFQEVNPLQKRAAEIRARLNAECATQPDLVGVKLFGVGFPFNLNSGLMLSVANGWPLKRLEAISLSRPGVNLVKHWVSWQLREERFALLAETLLPNWGKVLLVNLHIHHGIDAMPELYAELERIAKETELSETAVSELRDRLERGNLRRKQEMDVLLNHIDRLGPRYAAVVMAGDFNSTPESALAATLRDRGFHEVWENNPAPGYTYDRIANSANHMLQENFPLTLVVEDLSFNAKTKEALLTMARGHERRPRRIDFIWYRTSGIDVEVRHSEIVGLPNQDGLAPSDHFGVLAELEVR